MRSDSIPPGCLVVHDSLTVISSKYARLQTFFPNAQSGINAERETDPYRPSANCPESRRG